MKKIWFRVGAVAAAAIISSLMVLALNRMGRKGKGPIENAMAYTGDMVTTLEHKMITEQREEKREDRLKWLNSYKKSPKELLNPATILTGAYDNESDENFQGIVDLEDTLKTTFPLIHIYSAWGNKPNELFPESAVNSIVSLGSIPVITWEPWLNDFGDDEYHIGRTGDERNRNGMKDIAAGVYDKYIAAWARAAKRAGTPIMLRLGHEMNDGYRYPWGPQNNDTTEFIAAWQHIHKVFRSQQADNIIWIWSPHPAYPFKGFYPGAEYVDYVGVGSLNYGPIAAWSKWWSFKEIFGNHYKDLSAYGKPIIITEFGSLAVGGNRADWYRQAIESLPVKYPLVKGLIFFHFSKDNTTTQQMLNWTIKNDRKVTQAITAAMSTWR